MAKIDHKYCININKFNKMISKYKIKKNKYYRTKINCIGFTGMEEVSFLGLRSLLTGKAQDVTPKRRPSEG